ncbi:DUF3574 domain-containing protein [Streptomyces sp. NPDC048518]|uniref:DUF3574 domain-containing protein n=1 Tax=Streptomyces sp. NPDC048518 TaxID=3155029 RepID=UPI0033F86EC3
MPLTFPRVSRPRTTVAVAVTAVLAVGAPAAYATLDGEAGPSRAAGSAATTAARGKPFTETRLFFGTERPDGGPAVTDKQFLRFIDRQVTPDFPDGLTVQDGRGQWRDSNGKIERERSYELILLYPTTEGRKRDAQIEEIRGDYQKAFKQDSVARLDERTRADF